MTVSKEKLEANRSTFLEYNAAHTRNIRRTTEKVQRDICPTSVGVTNMDAAKGK